MRWDQIAAGGCSAGAIYAAVQCCRGETSHRVSYPKKISPEVYNLLTSPDFARASFMTWWKQVANQSRDFWIETPEELVRVHVAPRKKAFNPAGWSTSQFERETSRTTWYNLVKREQLKQFQCMLKVMLSEYVYVDEWRTGEVDEVKGQERLQVLWIGRSGFKRSESLEPDKAQIANVSSHVPMADEARGAGGRAGGLWSGHSCEVAPTGSEADCDRAARCEIPEDRVGHQGHDEAFVAGTQGQVHGEQHRAAERANQGTLAEDASGHLAKQIGPSHDVRQVQELAQQGSSRGLHGVGSEGEQIRITVRTWGASHSGIARCSKSGRPERHWSGDAEGRPGGECACGAASDVGEKLEKRGTQFGRFQEEPDIHGRDGCPDPQHESGHLRGGQDGTSTAAHPAGCADAEEPTLSGKGPTSQLSFIAGLGKTLRGCWSGENVENAVLDDEQEIGHAKRETDTHAAIGQHKRETESNAVIGHRKARRPMSSVRMAVENYEKEIGLARGMEETHGTDYEEGLGPVREDKAKGISGTPAETNHYVHEMEMDVGHQEALTVEVDADYEAAEEPSTNGDGQSPIQKAKEGEKRRRVERWEKKNPMKKEVYGAASSLHKVLMACVLMAGSMADEAALQPGQDLWHVLAGTRFGGEAEERPACLELFSGCRRITHSFAEAKQGVLRPRDLLLGDDLRDPNVRQEVYEEIRRRKPKLVWIAPPCTEYCGYSRINHTKQERRRRRAKEKVFLQLIDEII